jgi:hypothetical protein
MLYRLFLGRLRLGKLEKFLGVPFEFAVLQVSSAQLFDVRLKDLSVLTLCGFLDPCRSTLRDGHEVSAALEVVQLLGALLP